MRFHRCQTEAALRSLDNLCNAPARTPRAQALEDIGREIFAWSEQEGHHRTGQLLGCAARYRLGIVQAAGAKAVFNWGDFYYTDGFGAGARDALSEGGLMWNKLPSVGGSQFGVIDPLIDSLAGFARLSSALFREGDLGQPIVMSAVAAAQLAGSAQPDIYASASASVLEAIDLAGAPDAGHLHVGPGRLPLDLSGHTFGRWGEGYPAELERDLIEYMEPTGIGSVEVLRTGALVALAAHQIVADRRSERCSWPWASAVLAHAYAVTNASIPSKVIDSKRGYFWLSALSAVKEELEASGFVSRDELGAGLTAAGSEYMAEVPLRALKGKHREFFNAISSSVGDQALHRLRPWQVSALTRKMRDPRFPGLQL